MPSSLKSLLVALSVVLLTVVTANLLADEAAWSEMAEANVMAAGDAKDLVVKSTNSTPRLAVESLSEVYRFKVKADGRYTLRSVSFAAEWDGVNVNNWKLFEAHEGKVDFSHAVAHEEHRPGELLHLRFDTEQGIGFWGERREHEFVLTADVSEKEEDAWLELQVVPDTWAWVPGHFKEAWLNVREVHLGDDVEGLPGETWLLK